MHTITPAVCTRLFFFAHSLICPLHYLKQIPEGDKAKWHSAVLFFVYTRVYNLPDFSHSSPDGNNVDLYLKQLDRLRVAVDFFTHNNPNSVELSHVVRRRRRKID